MPDFFKVLPASSALPSIGRDQAYLWTDNWDDWFTFNTQYIVYVFDENAVRHRVGNVKIGEFGMKKDQRRPELRDEFDQIGEKFFSLGQDDECSGQPIPDSGLSFSSATAGGNPSLN
ncbi:hypothetical protein CJU41_00005 [Pseudomonas aeruginosa]|nr:hypothetical protein CJU40_00005 [Pseudomonas aeruginosa]PCA38679.1 hypothetical protein CJU41_00005 [Pseudomonas aeruginosa]PCA40753.1 hypothetical protein CJU39_21870 [Pseudomonas aeruginosa]